MIARLRDRWDGTFDAAGDDLMGIARKVYGDGDRSLGVRYSGDPNSPEVAIITDTSKYGETVLAYVLNVEDS